MSYRAIATGATTPISAAGLAFALRDALALSIIVAGCRFSAVTAAATTSIIATDFTFAIRDAFKALPCGKVALFIEPAGATGAFTAVITTDLAFAIGDAGHADPRVNALPICWANAAGPTATVISTGQANALRDTV